MPFNFTVPQFIDIEDKLVGPLSFRQFIYILGGLGGAFLIWRFLGFFGIVLIVPVVALSVALAFVKINNRPFIITFISAIKYYIKGKTFLWRKTKKTPEAKEIPKATYTTIPAPEKVSGKKLTDIAWSLDVHENLR